MPEFSGPRVCLLFVRLFLVWGVTLLLSFSCLLGSLCRRFSCSLFVWFYLGPVFSVDIPECACCSFDVFDLVFGSLLFEGSKIACFLT